MEFSNSDTLADIPCLRAPNGTSLWDAWARAGEIESGVFTPHRNEKGIRFPGEARCSTSVALASRLVSRGIITP